jgi:hypothetical protein
MLRVEVAKPVFELAHCLLLFLALLIHHLPLKSVVFLLKRILVQRFCNFNRVQQREVSQDQFLLFNNGLWQLDIVR